MKQDRAEATLAVDSRLEYIEKEMWALILMPNFGFSANELPAEESELRNR
jgi:hypothetical protein